MWTDTVKRELQASMSKEKEKFGRNCKKQGTESHERSTSPTDKYAGGSVMFWACVAFSGIGKIGLVEERMWSIKNLLILELKIALQ